MNRRYILPIFIGSTGSYFYLNTLTSNFFTTTPFGIIIRLAIFLMSTFLLQRGYKLINADVPSRKSVKVTWTIAFLLLFIGIISLVINHYFGFILGFSAAVGLNILLNIFLVKEELKLN